MTIETKTTIQAFFAALSMAIVFFTVAAGIAWYWG